MCGSFPRFAIFIEVHFSLDRRILGLFVIVAMLLAGWSWLRDHPEHNPWAPLHIDDAMGWATSHKLARLRDEPEQCHAFLERSGIDFKVLPPMGEGPCLRSDRLVLEPDRAAGLNLYPTKAQATCAVNVGIALWFRHGVQPAAEEFLGSRVVTIEHLGTNACRRIGGAQTGKWSEHATGNAIDIAAFVLEDGRRISVLADWREESQASAFLRSVHGTACGTFGTALSPEYNAAHAGHFHFDQAGGRRLWSYCR